MFMKNLYERTENRVKEVGSGNLIKSENREKYESYTIVTRKPN